MTARLVGRTDKKGEPACKIVEDSYTDGGKAVNTTANSLN
jgi:hypothetical protein